MTGFYPAGVVCEVLNDKVGGMLIYMRQEGQKLRLLSNYLPQFAELSGLGLQVVEWVPLTLLFGQKTGLAMEEGWPGS
jgi:GTP cyclohydrolase II